MKRTTCSACGHDDLEQFLDLGYSPIADAYTSTPDEHSPAYPLQVAVCAKCRLVQLLEVIDDLFGTGYSFYSSASPPLSAYHERYAQTVLQTRGAGKWVLEVGCNDGDLLRHFAAAGCLALGVDPATGPANAARARGLEVINEPFGLKLARQIRDERGGQDYVIANHVLAHVEDVGDVLAGIAHVLADGGTAFVEVQYLPDLLVNNAFDLVYHEHRNFFSLSSLEAAAGRWDLHVVGAQLTDRQGGSLRVALARQPRSNSRADQIRSREAWLNHFSAYEGMQGRAERIRDRLLDMLNNQPGPIAAYGAPAKATTLLNFCGIDSSTLAFCIDTTPAKQGRHIPGTGIPIVPPRVDAGITLTPRQFYGADTFLLCAWNYQAQIMRNNPGPQWIVPFPAPVLL